MTTIEYTTDPAQHLRNALTRIRHHGWQQGATGFTDGPRDLLMSLPNYGPEVLHALRTAIDPGAQYVSLIEWNDQIGRTVDEVVAVLEKAIVIAEVSVAA